MDHSNEESSLPPPLPPGRPSTAFPPPNRPQKVETWESHEVVPHESDEYEEEPSATSFDFPRYTEIASHPQGKASQEELPETEVLADEDGGMDSFPQIRK